MFTRGLLFKTVFILIGIAVNQSAAQNPYQTIILSNTNQPLLPGKTVIVKAIYDVSDGNSTLTGIGVRFHFDSRKLRFIKYEHVAGGLVGDPDIKNETHDKQDNDPNTDTYILFPWYDLQGNWPNQNLPLEVVHLYFTVTKTAPECTTAINAIRSSGAFGYDFETDNASIRIHEKVDLIDAIQILQKLSRM